MHHAGQNTGLGTGMGTGPGAWVALRDLSRALLKSPTPEAALNTLHHALQELDPQVELFLLSMDRALLERAGEASTSLPDLAPLTVPEDLALVHCQEGKSVVGLAQVGRVLLVVRCAPEASTPLLGVLEVLLPVLSQSLNTHPSVPEHREDTLRYTSALLRISEVLLEEASSGKLGAALLSESRRVLGAVSTSIFVTGPDGQGLHMHASHNAHPDVHQQLQFIPQDARNPVMEVARTGQKQVFASKQDILHRYPNLKQVVDDMHGNMVVLLPLSIGPEVLGVLYFGFEAGRVLSAEEHALLDNISRQVAQALERNRLHQQQNLLIQQHQETVALLQAVMHNAPIGLAFLDDQLTFKMVNRPMAGMLNGTPPDFIGVKPTDRFPLFGQLIENQLRQVLNSGAPQLNIEYSMPEGMGRPLQDWLVNYFPVKTPEGEALGVGATIQDITRQKTSERILQETQLFREKIMQTAPVVIYLIDLQAQHIVYSNQHMAEVLGYTLEEIEHMSVQNVLSLVHPEDLRATQGVLGRMESLQSGDVISVEARFRHKDGSWRWFFVKYTLFSRIENRVLVLGLALDITERRHIEHQLNESEQRFKDVANSVPILIWMGDQSRARTFFNRTWLEFTGRSFEESAGYGWTTMVHPDDIERYLEVYHQHFEQREEFQIEYRLRRFDGAYRWILARGVPRFSSAGEFLGFIGGCIDIHERKVAEEALQEREAELQKLMGAQKRFVADAAHELRTPLTAIQGNLDILIRHPHIPEEEKKEIIGDVQREATRLGRLVHDMLTLARGDSGLAFKEEEVELHQVLRSAFREAERLTVHHTLRLSDVQEVSLYGDRDRLKQLALILLENAIKYTPPGGTIEGTLRCQDHLAELRIRDTGVGIAEEDLPRVFERFYRVDKARQRSEDPGGTGLGLPIARWIVEQHGGQIWLESELGKGTTVVVQLRVEAFPGA